MNWLAFSLKPERLDVFIEKDGTVPILLYESAFTSTEHWATWRRWRRREWSDARSEGWEGRREERSGGDARMGDCWGESGGSGGDGEGRGEKERGCAPSVEGIARDTSVEEAIWDWPEGLGKDPDRRSTFRSVRPTSRLFGFGCSHVERPNDFW